MSLYSGLSNNRLKQQPENNRNKGIQNRYLQVKTETNKGRLSCVENLGDFSEGFTLRSIIIKTAAATGISPKQILGPRRRPDIVHARQLVYKIAVEFTNYSYPQIGNMLNRDHSTIIQGLVGRLTGYDDNGTSICYTNIDTIQRYELLWNSKFNPDIKWNSKTTKHINIYNIYILCLKNITIIF